jgi:membrane associated rhomboid family serine protease
MKIPIEVQALIFFAGCTVAGIGLLILAATGSIRDPVVGVSGAVAAVGGACVFVRGLANVREQRDASRMRDPGPR